jgi:hypothetical protein
MKYQGHICALGGWQIELAEGGEKTRKEGRMTMAMTITMAGGSCLVDKRQADQTGPGTMIGTAASRMLA